MFRLSFLLGVFCSLQNGFAKPMPPPTEGINFEYVPPPPKSDSEIFMAILEPTGGTNVTVEQFMYHFKHSTYASAFLMEIFTLGINTHLFIDRPIANPTDEERRIAIAVGKLWTELAYMRAVNRITLEASIETAHHYLRAENKSDTMAFAISKLKDAAIADPILSEAYAKEKKRQDAETLPPLFYVNINLTKFGSIDRTLIKKVWPDPKSFPLIAHARFSQHLQTKVENATGEDYDNVLLAHLLVDATSIPEVKDLAQKAFEEGITQSIKKAFEFLRLTKVYDEFDRVLFASLNIAVKSQAALDAKLMEMKSNYPPAPQPEV